jgi:aminopeptidase-like protein
MTLSAGARSLAGIRAGVDLLSTGQRLHDLARRLFPICRSITGDGVRQTLRVLQELAPIVVHEVPSGTPVFDWTVPREWNVRDAFVANARGDRVIDFRAHTLHLVGYSVPVRRRMQLAELRPHLHSLPDRPDLIPYRTSYYEETWGFCVSHRLLESLPDGEYEVCVDATLEEGSLTYGECLVRGRTDEEVLISCHTCHPSLCNDNLSGLVLAALLARTLEGAALRHSYRFLFAPGTIGAITWLARHEADVRRIRHGLVLTCLGDAGAFTYKRSRRGDTATDHLVEHVLAHGSHAWQVRDFSPYGYDERQYCSPGFDLPVGRLSRSPHHEFPEYHTSADDLAFVTPGALAASYATLLAIVDAFESNRRYRNLNPKCEPQLGRRGLYESLGGTERAAQEMAMLWVLNGSDGTASLIDIARRARLPFDAIRDAALRLERHGLLAPCDDR